MNNKDANIENIIFEIDQKMAKSKYQKINKLKKLISENKYRIETEKLADSMLNKFEFDKVVN